MSISRAQLFLFPAQLPVRAKQGIQRAGHWKAKSRALETKERSNEKHNSGRYTLESKFTKIKHHMINWNLFGTF